MKRLPIRGGNWNNGANAGLGCLNLNNSRANANNNIGFRPALDKITARSSHPISGCCQCQIQKDAAASANAEKQIKPLDASGGCIYEKIFQFDNLLTAAYQCRSGKVYKRSTLEFFDNLEENIVALQNDLIWGTYIAAPYHHFWVYEPKRRLISAPSFRDRVLHRAIHNLIEPLFDKRFEHDSYACRKGKGTHAGADRAQSFIRYVEAKHGKAYALKADIKHYFSSIQHDKLKSLIGLKISCKKTTNLLNYIIDASPMSDGAVGIPLGNLTSQLFANIYLHELDRFAKHTLKAKHYVRYMDDFIFIHKDKGQLQQWRLEVEDFLQDHLALKTNSKTQVFPIGVEKGRALDFLGYRIYSTHRLLRKSSVKRIKTSIKKLRAQYEIGEIEAPAIRQKLQSWIGHAKHASTLNLRIALFNNPFRK